MAKVPNWQLGREMSYPYEKPAAAGKQFSAVFNINRCIACQTCTMACKSTWTFSQAQEATSTVFSPQGGQGPEHQTWFFYLQRICNHCSYPACLAACPRKAIYKREEDGIVLVDQARCRGYRKCVEACPYKKVMYRGNTRVSEKCIACYPRVEGTDPLTEGEPMVTRCISVCVGKIRLQGWVDDPKSPLNFLVHKERVALPLYPQFGTQPNVYYIPPRWVPRQYLRQMFGPGVDEALQKYASPSHELPGVTQSLLACDDSTE